MPPCKKKNTVTPLPLNLAGIPDNVPLIRKEDYLREYADNSRGKRKLTEQASAYVGVYKQPDDKWRAQISVNGKVHNLGHFTNEEDAARQYAKAAWRYKQHKRPDHFGGLDLSGVPKDLPLIANAAGSKTPYKGIKACKGRWQARITVHGKPKTLGTFDTPEDAAQVHARAVCFLENQKRKTEETITTIATTTARQNKRLRRDTCQQLSAGEAAAIATNTDPISPAAILPNRNSSEDEDNDEPDVYIF